MAQRPPRESSSGSAENPTKLDGLLPYAFLAAIIRSEYVEINGVKHRPTLKEQKQAAERLVAALSGTQQEQDDFYSQVEKGSL